MREKKHSQHKVKRTYYVWAVYNVQISTICHFLFTFNLLAEQQWTLNSVIYFFGLWFLFICWINSVDQYLPFDIIKQIKSLYFFVVLVTHISPYFMSLNFLLHIVIWFYNSNSNKNIQLRRGTLNFNQVSFQFIHLTFLTFLSAFLCSNPWFFYPIEKMSIHFYMHFLAQYWMKNTFHLLLSIVINVI